MLGLPRDDPARRRPELRQIAERRTAAERPLAQPRTASYNASEWAPCAAADDPSIRPRGSMPTTPTRSSLLLSTCLITLLASSGCTTLTVATAGTLAGIAASSISPG